MAKATKTEIKQTVTTLELSDDEAQTLLYIMDSVGGDPKKSRRKHADAIGMALAKLGFKRDDFRHPIADGSIHFEDGK